MEAQLRAEVNPPICDGVRPALEELATADGAPSLSAWMMKHGTEDHLREFLVHRSAYQLKEADPHSWAIPRTTGATKRALLQIQLDEYGDLKPGASHAELFAATMSAVGLDPTYGAYVECLPAPTLATGNLISFLGMQRRLLGALLGHLALFEMTSVGPMSRYAAAMDRMGFPPSATRFFRVHVEADADHEVLALNELVGDHVARHPCDEADVIFGACALAHVERAFTETLLDAFESNISALVSAQPDWSLGHSPDEMMAEEASRGCVDSQASEEPGAVLTPGSVDPAVARRSGRTRRSNE
jgi:hypothetical protein